MESQDREWTLHPDRRGVRMVLGDLEAQIMDVIWGSPGGEWCTVRDVYETLRDGRAIAYTTVMNTMTRLAKKGVLEAARREQAYLYRPRAGRDVFMQGVIGHVLEQMLVQFTGPTEAALADYVQRHGDEDQTVQGFLQEIDRRGGAASGNPVDEGTT